jgi:putative phosphoribosyl transferase
VSQLPNPHGDGLDSFEELLADWSDGHPRFADRRDAGRRLAAVLGEFRYQNPVVVGLPRGGMPVAAEVARALGAPLEVVGLCALARPEDPNCALGVVAEPDISVIDHHALEGLRMGADELDAAVEHARHELESQLARYYPSHRRLAVAERTVLLVDDGLVSSGRVQAAARSLQMRGATRVVLAVPVAEANSAIAVREWVDEVVCLEYRRQPRSLEFWYDDFSQTSEQEVAALLSEHAGEGVRDVAIEVAPGIVLSGYLTVPWGAYARGAVLLASGLGSAPLARRSESLARALNKAGVATLLLDLMVPGEQIEPTDMFDLDLLAQRLVAATTWLRAQPETARLALSYLGMGAASPAALVAAAKLRAGICAVVSCDGCPDSANAWLGEIIAPVLLITCDADAGVLDRTRDARRTVKCRSALAVVGAPLFAADGPDPVERMSCLAIDWFTQHLSEIATIRGVHRVALV